MKNQRKWWLSLACLLIIALFVACGGGDSETAVEPTETTTETEAVEAAPEPTEAPAETEAVEEPASDATALTFEKALADIANGADVVNALDAAVDEIDADIEANNGYGFGE